MAIQDFLLDTDKSIDKIVNFDHGSFSVGAGTSVNPTVNHGLTFRPLYIVRWSTSPTFDSSFDELGVSTINNLSFFAQTDTTTTYFFANNTGSSSVTIYWEIIYYMPPDVDLDVTGTSSQLDTFVLDTDLNYTKVLFDDKTVSGTATITHGLGYYPQVEVWYVRASDGRLVHNVQNEVTTPATIPACEVNTTQIILTDPGGIITFWYYRIYADEI